MSGIDLFLDSSALIAGIFSQTGASRALLLLGEDGKVQLKVSQQVIIETERNLAKKVPKALPFAREIILTAKIRIHSDPTYEEVQEHMDWIRSFEGEAIWKRYLDCESVNDYRPIMYQVDMVKDLTGVSGHEFVAA